MTLRAPSASCSSPALLPPAGCKRVFFVRHAEGTHNVAEREHGSPDILLEEHSGTLFMDPPLTDTGQEQCAGLRDALGRGSLQHELDLVVVSPLLRTLQTASLVFHDLPRVSSSRPVPFLANELCRERIHHYMCDKRQDTSVHRQQFAHVDFAHIESEQDRMFHEKEIENDEELCSQRALAFLEWLKTREETNIAVVTHMMFLRHVFRGQWAEGFSEDYTASFENAELRPTELF